jgi:hypothetical protein
MPDQPAATPRPRSKRERRLRALVRAVGEPGDELVAWTRVWVSRDGRLHGLAARTLDHAVVTRLELLLFSTGFFSRRPRRLVYARPLRELTVVPLEGRGPAVRIVRPGDRPLRLEGARSAQGDHFRAELLAGVAWWSNRGEESP